MTLVTARLYRDGRMVADHRRIDAITPPDPCDRDALLWVGLEAPDTAELERIGAILGLHPLAIEDATKAHQLPKLEQYDRHLFVVALTATAEELSIHFGQTAVFCGPNIIVTARHGSVADHGAVRRQLEATPAMLAQGSDRVLHAVLDKIVDDYVPTLEAIERAVDAREEAAFVTMPDVQSVRELFALRRTLTRFESLIEPMESVASYLANDDLAFIDRGMRPYFRDIADHVRRSVHEARDLRDTLMAIVETGSILEQQRQGAITRKLAAWAAILAVPTAIAGIYGMNFEVMPELRWRFGYAAVLGTMAAICALLYWRFRRSGWL